MLLLGHLLGAAVDEPGVHQAVRRQAVDRFLEGAGNGDVDGRTGLGRRLGLNDRGRGRSHLRREVRVLAGEALGGELRQELTELFVRGIHRDARAGDLDRGLLDAHDVRTGVGFGDLVERRGGAVPLVLDDDRLGLGHRGDGEHGGDDGNDAKSVGDAVDHDWSFLFS